MLDIWIWSKNGVEEHFSRCTHCLPTVHSHYTSYVHRVLGGSIVCGCKLDGHIYLYCAYTYICTYITYLRTYIAYRPTILYMAQCIGCTADEPTGLECTIHNISVAMVVHSHCTTVHVGIGRHSILHLTTIARLHLHPHTPEHTCLMSLSLCQCHMSLWRYSHDCVVLHGTTCPCVLGVYTCLNGY